MKLQSDDLGVLAQISLNGSSGVVTLRAEHLRSERTGIHAMVSVSYQATRLAYDTFNVSRDEERNKLSKSAHGGLSASCQSVYPREALKNDLDNFCAGVWEIWQQRDPAIEIITDPDDTPQPPAWLLEPLVLAEQPNILFGQRSAAKSLTSLVIAATLQLQWAENPFRLKAPEHYSEVLYLDFERNDAMARYNMSRLQRGMGLPSLSIHYKRLAGPLARNAEWVRTYVRAHTSIRLVIIDSLTPACGGNLNDTGPASEFFDAERTLRGTTLILAHTSKDVTTSKKTVVGTFAFESYAGNVWECVKSQEEESSIADICLYHRKPPAVYRVRRPIAYRVTFDEENHALTTAHLNPEQVSEFIEKMVLPTRIRHLLKHDQLTTEEIGKALPDVDPQTLKVTLSRMKAKDIIVAVDKEGRAIRWGLAEFES